MGTSFGLVDTSKNFCAHGSVVYGSLALVACYIVGLIVEWFTCIVIVRRSANDKVCCSMTIVIIVASILLVVFIMADNHLPLEYHLCYFPLNETQRTDAAQRISGVRAGMSGFCFVTASIICLIIGCLSPSCTCKHVINSTTNINSTTTCTSSA